MMRTPVLILFLLVGSGLCAPVRAAEADPDTAFLDALVSNLESVSGKVLRLAESIPAEKYSWSPTPEVRTVSEVFMHIVGGNFQLPADLGAPPPESVELSDRSVWGLKQQRRLWEEKVVQKDAVIEILSQSFDYAMQSIPGITNLEERASTWGFPASKRDYLLLLVSHAHEHLGQSVTYARALGITPPWSRRPKQEQAASTAVLEHGVATGKIVSIDKFGNVSTSLVATDLEALALEAGDYTEIEACGSTIDALLGEQLFDVRPGEWVAFVSPLGTLTVFKSFGNAAEHLGCEAGAPITVRKAEK